MVARMADWVLGPARRRREAVAYFVSDWLRAGGATTKTSAAAIAHVERMPRMLRMIRDEWSPERTWSDKHGTPI